MKLIHVVSYCNVILATVSMITVLKQIEYYKNSIKFISYHVLYVSPLNRDIATDTRKYFFILRYSLIRVTNIRFSNSIKNAYADYVRHAKHIRFTVFCS